MRELAEPFSERVFVQEARARMSAQDVTSARAAAAELVVLLLEHRQLLKQPFDEVWNVVSKRRRGESVRRRDLGIIQDPREPNLEQPLFPLAKQLGQVGGPRGRRI